MEDSPTVVANPRPGYQSFPKQVAPIHNARITKYFKLFPYLHEDIKMNILQYLADAPFESLPENYPNSSLTHGLNQVCHSFRKMCNADVLWKNAIVRLANKEPSLWKPALASCCCSVVLSPAEAIQQDTAVLMEKCHAQLKISYKSIFETIVNQHLRFKGPVFYMPGQVALGQAYSLHLFEFRYRFMITEVMRDRHAESSANHDGDVLSQQQSQSPAYFIHANRTPLEPTVPAVLVRVVQCHRYADGRADVTLLPVAYVWMEKVWVRPNSGQLFYGQCLKMGQRVTDQMNYLQRQEALVQVMDRLQHQLLAQQGGITGSSGTEEEGTGSTEDGDQDAYLEHPSSSDM